MGLIVRSHKVNLIAGLLSNDTDKLAKARESLRKTLGPIDFVSDITDFTYTDYYKEEMGDGLKRQFVSFKKPFSLDGICSVKIKTNDIEKRLSSGGKRRVNIDPGYIDLSKLVLFSTKDFSHRICLGRGIYSEVTLIFREKTFRPLPWTYPDYKTRWYIEIFERIRIMYKAKTV